MKFSIVSAAVMLPVVVYAHGADSFQHHARQAPAVAAPAASSASASASAPPAGTPVATTGAPEPTTPAPVASESLTFTLDSVNPSAVPLSLITSGTMSQSDPPLSTIYPAGSQPTYLPGAPAIPDANALNPADYPTLDKTPPTDSPQVLQWIQEVANSGVVIPDIPPTLPGGCPANPAAVANTSNCWWTCGGCVVDTDVTTCPDKLTWGLTYDDGPSAQNGTGPGHRTGPTTDLLQYLAANNLHSTFFVVGSRVISYPDVVQYEYMQQHQIAVHTWSHPYMTTLTTEEVIAELGWSKKVIKDTLGVTPAHWRPPYGDVDNRVRAIAQAMDLQTVIWTRISPSATFDTGDFTVAAGLTTAAQVLNNWENIAANASLIDSGFILLEHDLYQQSVDLAVGYILPDALGHSPQFTIQPVITCLGKPLTDAYLETNDNSTNPIAPNVKTPVTLSSGAPGSVQATGAAGSSGSGTPNKSSAVSILLGLSSSSLMLSIAMIAGAFTFML